MLCAQYTITGKREAIKSSMNFQSSEEDRWIDVDQIKSFNKHTLENIITPRLVSRKNLI